MHKRTTIIGLFSRPAPQVFKSVDPWHFMACYAEYLARRLTQEEAIGVRLWADGRRVGGTYRLLQGPTTLSELAREGCREFPEAWNLLLQGIDVSHEEIRVRLVMVIVRPGLR
ncbi:hypothetical protein Mterra_00614 [Calidithermus terrae]|uniref:Uncharacterized protein n=1 Tax=Calidithermus terrae TaxID=1408545 RepID=A0A399F4P2_9DEIN|nr:hypothetical protein [Calidithermus terrae]RIH90239.1 hypothetical protein Mterra_00614 [Calidithermus terrae]